MSISTLENPQSRRLLDSAHAAADTHLAAVIDAQAEIRQAFGLMRTVPMARVAVPEAQYRGARPKVGSTSLDEAAISTIEEEEVRAALLAVLAGSDCPLVQKLRESMCEQWVSLHADDIAELRA